MEGLKQLTILVPEVLTHELDAIEHIRRQHPLDLETLVARYCEARTQVTGSPKGFTIGFLALVERLFGTDAARGVEERPEKRAPPRPGGA